MYRHVALGSQSDRLREYVSSMKEIDPWIYDEVILVLLAHIIHLYEKGIISREIASRIVRTLLELRNRKNEILKLPYEDVHEALEAKIIEKLSDDGAWINLGKSRNDQVVTAIRMKLRTTIIDLLNLLINLRWVLIEKAKGSIDIIIPYYTHQQPAQISVLAHYILSLEEMLRINWGILFNILKECINLCPQGSAACASTTVPLDRKRIARLLGFKAPIENALYATSTRDFILHTTSALVVLLLELSRFIEDFILWNMPQIGYIILNPNHVSTSSIMPHKRNPVTLEISRARIGSVIGEHMSIISIYKSLPSGYNLDLQEITRHLRRIIETSKDTIEVLIDIIKTSSFNKDRMLKDATTYPIIASDVAEQLSLKAKIPFRKAYFEIAKLLAEYKSLDKVVKVLNEKYNLELKLKNIRDWLSLKQGIGSPNIRSVKESIRRAISSLNRDKSLIEEYTKYVNRGLTELESKIKDILRC